MPADTPHDIRHYFTPPRGGVQQERGTPHAHGVSPTSHNQQQQQHRTPNRRRIITSDDDLPIAAENGQAAAEVPNAEHQPHDQVDPAIVIESSEDDEPDDIWVRPNRSTPQQQQVHQPAPIQPRAAIEQQQKTSGVCAKPAQAATTAAPDDSQTAQTPRCTGGCRGIGSDRRRLI